LPRRSCLTVLDTSCRHGNWRKIAVTLIEDFELGSVLVSYFPLAFSTPSHRTVMRTMAGLAETDYRYSRSQKLTLDKDTAESGGGHGPATDYRDSSRRQP
jgi:hypothetical protein